MTNYNSIFGSASSRIGSTFQDEEDEKKKTQTPSQKVGTEQKTVTSQSSYDRIFGGANQRLETSTPKKLKQQEPDTGFKTVEDSAKDKMTIEGEEKQLGFFEKASKKAGEIFKGVKEALLNKPAEKTAEGVSVEVQMTPDEAAQNVGRVVELRVEMQQQLEDAKIDLDNFYRDLVNSGKEKQLGYMLQKDSEGHYKPVSTPGFGYDPLYKYHDEHYAKIKNIQALNSGITELDQFTADAPARLGILQTIWGKLKNEGYETVVPFARGNYDKWLYSGEREAIQKYKRGEELTKEEQVFVNTFRARVYGNYLDKGIPEQAGEVIADIPRYAVEIYATAGIVNPLTSKLAAGVTTSAAPPIIKAIAPKLINNSVKMAAASNLNIPGISGKMAEYMLPTFDYEQGLGGKDILDNLSEGDAPMEAGKKAYLTNLVEYVSEGVGAYIDDALPFVKKAFVSKWLSSRNVIDKAPGIITKTLRTANFNSLVGEVLEEEIGEPFQAAIEKRDYKDPLFTPEGRERLMVEVLGIGVFSGMAAVSDKAVAKIVDRRKKTGDKIDIVPTTEKAPEAEKPKEPPTAEQTFEEKQGLQPQVPPTTPQGPGEQKEEEPVKREVTPEPLGRLATVFRGAKDQTVDTEIQNGITGGVSTSLDENVAKQFAERVGGTVEKYTISPDAKVVNHSALEEAVADIPLIKDKTAAIKQIIKDQGIDVVKFDVPEGAKGENELRVVNAAVLQKVEEKEEPKVRVTGAEVTTTTQVKKKPISDKFFVTEKAGEFREVEGEPVNVGAGIDAFVNKDPSGNGNFNVTEGRTGLSIASASTKSAAVKKAREILAKNVGTLDEVIDRQIKEKGESPRYLDKSGIISENEKSTNQNLGGNDRPGQPADTIPASQDQPGGTGEAAQVDSGEVARGVSESGDSGAGERPTTRLELLDELPEAIQSEAINDWTENYANTWLREKNQKLKDQLEEAFISKWRRKATEYNEPVVPSKVDQVQLNKDIEELVERKGFDGYTPEEIAMLKKYAGAGGLERVGAEGRGLLDEYYTPKPIVDFMWEKVRELQPNIDTMVEPSVGIGRFLEGAPEGVTIRGAEINNISYIIAKVLHPKAFLVNRPFEDYFVDTRGNEKEFKADAQLVIGNPPYGEHRGKYLGLGEESKLIKYEDYFMKRGLNLLEDDGLLAYVIPSSFLRSGNYYAKQAISVIGFMEDAYRLPEGVFGTTTIGTDIIFIRKTPTTDEAEIARRVEELSNNSWFNTNPDKVLGEVSLGTGRYGGDEVIGTLENAMKKARAKPAEIEDTMDEETLAENIRVEEGEVLEDEAETQNAENPPVNRVPEALAVTDGLNQEKAEPDPEKLKELKYDPSRLELNVYNPGTGANPGSKYQLQIRYKGFAADKLDFDTREEAEAAKKTYVFKGMTTNVAEDYAGSRFFGETYRRGLRPTGIVPAVTNDLNKRAQIIPNKKDSLLQLNEISEGDLALWKSVTVTGELNSNATAAFDPKTFFNTEIAIVIEGSVPKYYPNILYYQGNIYEKLDELELFRDKINPRQYELQKRKLEEVMPEPESLTRTNLQPISDWVKQLNFQTDNGSVGIMTLFRDFLHGLPWESYGSSSSWEIEGYINGSIVNTGDKLQNIEVRKRRRQVGNSLFRRFMMEVLTPEQQKQVEDQYNRNFNAYYRPDYRQVPILSAINANFNPKKKAGKHPLIVKEIQKEGAAFLATKGAGTLAYDVGVGKTLTAIMAINDVMKRGWAKKPLVVVPNGVYRNWINEISEVIPGVKINSLMNLGAAFKGDLKTLEIEDGTLSIITYEGLTRLGFREDTYANLTDGLRDVMTGVNNTKRAAEKELAQVEQQIGRAIKGTTEDRFFEDLGFDHITIDEVHNFKNIFAGAKVERGNGNEYRNVRGSSSARGIKAYLMAQYVLGQNNNRNVFLLSATPFTNSPLEIYSILSLMGKRRLEEIGLKNVNDFMSMFMELKPTFQVKADQSVKEEDVIEKFQNLQQLQKLVTEFIDFRTGEEAGVERPGKLKRTITLSPTEKQNEYVKLAQPLFNDKDKGGAIVAITELQNITLSPYLSRFNSERPTYREFVDNSPKIKFAIEGVAQTFKDNKNVGQIIYMPRGVDHFDLLREYLIKEKGFKASQIGMITGGMNINVKQQIQNDFNSGTVKVLIGTEAIKEGVNLQEKTTDLYHLHLPWNPTDMLQVEGRLWRQGNEWSNVRIHYPLIENSVDSFIFQKLETKEKRIKNLWSYKDSEIDVGDLDFENMKLDLITNPVIRVRAERTFETKKESQKLEQLKVEQSFTDRKIIKVKEAELELKQSEKYLANDPEDAYWKKQVSKTKAALTNAKRDLVQKGIDVPDLEKKSKELQAEIDAQQKIIEGLDTKFDALMKEAEGKQEVIASKVNNYAEHIAPIAEENKTFFVKKQPNKKVSSSDYKAPGGTADVGGYADVESAEKTVSNLKSVEFPELLRLVQELTGETPTLKKFRRALGRFYGTRAGFIKLSPDIFKDPKLAAKVFAHELGHLADYLPDKTLLRGNILGRIATLNNFLRGTFGEKEISNADIRAELKDLSQAWKPFDELENPGFTSYRYSSRELYADAISVLFNDPALLREKAPTFYTAFFDELDAKEDFKAKFFALQDMLNQGEEAVFNSRDEALSKAYAKAEETWKAKEAEKRQRKQNVFHVLALLFSDKNAPINRRVREKIKAGAKIEDTANPAFQFASLKYMEGKIKNFIADNFQAVYVKANSVNDGWNLLGKILQLERALYERGDLANPGGYDKKTAKDQLDAYEKFTDPADWKVIQEAKEDFRKGVQAVVTLAEENKFYAPEMLETMKANPAYATFQVIDYLDTYISSSIKHQVGTLKDVANPATSTIMKAIATMRAIEYNNAKISAVEFHKEQFADEIESAKTVFTGKGFKIMDPVDRDQDLVIVIRDGKAEGWYVPTDVGRVLNGNSTEVIAMAAKLSRMISGTPFYRPLFTTVNLGFQTFNFVRDFTRYWKNVPDKTLGEAITSLPRAAWRYAQAVPVSYARAANLPNEILKKMENEKILGLTFNDLFQSPEVEDTQIERTLQKVGILQKEKTKNALRIALTPFTYTLEKVQQIGDFIETLPKAAAYIELEGKMPKEELAEFIRTKVGSPSFRTGGELTPITNNLFMFSNAYVQGIKTDFQVATDPKTRGGFWWKTVVATFLPKMIMLGISLGLAGDWLKERFRDVSEYDKTNYTIIPIGVDENGKTIYWRLPQDETGRFLGGLLWKLGRLGTREQLQVSDFFNVIDFGAGQVPNLAPGLVGVGAILSYLSGRNPYDEFRGRFIIPEKEFNAGFDESFPLFMDWLLKQQGLGIVVPSFTPQGEITKLQEFLHAPVLSNIAGRWMKVSDYGRTEESFEISAQFDREAAKKSLDRERKVDAAVKKYVAGDLSDTRRKQIELELIREVVGEGPYKDERKAEATRLVTAFKRGVVKGRSDTDANSLIYANTNDEKFAQVQRIYDEMGGDTREFRDFINEMRDYKVISNDFVKRVRDEILK